MTVFNLLKKTELRIENISLHNANLNDIASIVADILGLQRKDVLVIDVRDSTMAIDILKGELDASNIVAKRDELFRRLTELQGVCITEETTICSEGMLSWIALDREKTTQALKESEKIAEEIRRRISKRAIVFSTGFEVSGGYVRDTNTPAICMRLESEGYSATQGDTLRDDEILIAARLRQAVDDGYGLIITTGGVGAEDKDRTIEGVLALEPGAATPYICRYQKGVGRHHKDGVRIAVGEYSDSLIIALPGPNDEVRVGIETLVRGLRSGLSKELLAEAISGALKRRLEEKLK